jgi:hypothetical protein
MNQEEAKSYIGKEVWSRDAGSKMVRYGPPHGPWTLERVLKGGLAIIRRELPPDKYGHSFIDYRKVPPTCLLPPPETNPT